MWAAGLAVARVRGCAPGRESRGVTRRTDSLELEDPVPCAQPHTLVVAHRGRGLTLDKRGPLAYWMCTKHISPSFAMHVKSVTYGVKRRTKKKCH